MYHVSGELLDEEEGFPQQGVAGGEAPVRPLQLGAQVLQRLRLIGPRAQVPAEAHLLHAQTLRRLLPRTQELHHQELERDGETASNV